VLQANYGLISRLESSHFYELGSFWENLGSKCVFQRDSTGIYVRIGLILGRIWILRAHFWLFTGYLRDSTGISPGISPISCYFWDSTGISSSVQHKMKAKLVEVRAFLGFLRLNVAELVRLQLSDRVLPIIVIALRLNVKRQLIQDYDSPEIVEDS
jgi:hypothetical protein